MGPMMEVSKVAFDKLDFSPIGATGLGDLKSFNYAITRAELEQVSSGQGASAGIFIAGGGWTKAHMFDQKFCYRKDAEGSWARLIWIAARAWKRMNPEDEIDAAGLLCDDERLVGDQTILHRMMLSFTKTEHMAGIRLPHQKDWTYVTAQPNHELERLRSALNWNNQEQDTTS